MKPERRSRLFLTLVLICAVAAACVRRAPQGRPGLVPAAGPTPSLFHPPGASSPLAALTSTPLPRQPTAPPSPQPATPTPLPETLRTLADSQGMSIGAAVDLSPLSEDSTYTELLTTEFNALGTENVLKWERVHPQREVYNFQGGDTLVAFARSHAMQVMGHVLVWDNQLPDWIVNGQFTKEEWLDILRDHIYTVVGHYRGQIAVWDVVNEAVNTDGTLRDTIWMHHIGPQYIPLAFRWAHEADPDAILIYNDGGGEGLNPKADAIYALAQGLLQAGAPLQGVGLQMHVWLGSPPTQDELQANMHRLANLGLKVYITEMDVRLQYSQADEATKQKEQAEVYRQAFAACLQMDACRGFYTWGVFDRYTWITDHTHHEDYPLLFDQEGRPKPAYKALFETLKASP